MRLAALPTAVRSLGVRLTAALTLVPALALSGCAANKWVSLRTVPHSGFSDALAWNSEVALQPSERTQQVLRVYNLTDALGGEARPLLEKLQAIIDREPTADKVYAMAEIAYLGAKRAQGKDRDQARDLYAATVLHTYRYLFDARFAVGRNPYDPQFRGACDLYNSGLEAALRAECKGNQLLPGHTSTIQTSAGPWDITCVLRGGEWRPEEFARFEFVSDYEIRGLRNHYLQYGLGVPLIAVRRPYSGEPPAARYYPAKLSFPVTALLRPLPNEPAAGDAAPRHRAVLEMYDPLVTSELNIADRHAPLESDLSTPLAYFLADFKMDDVATQGLFSPDTLLRPDALLNFRPNRSQPIMGLYMVQPYQPGKIPVLMVHGLWSSPMTWMEVFNDLRSIPAIRERYQFWFYLYPTGQPFWISASQLRADLNEVRQVLDPGHQEPALDQMVLIGHSMGGLVSKLQTVNSGDEYWRLVTPEPLDRVKANADVRMKLQNCFYFQPNPAVRRVIAIATPNRGSPFSNQTTQWLVNRIIHLPDKLVQSQEELFRDNPQAFGNESLLRIENSIDSLAPRTPIFGVMQSSRRPPWVKYHSIVGSLPPNGLFSPLAVGGDGVVSLESAHVPDAESELVVPADHMTVHTHPLAVLEVRRILLEHLAELEAFPGASPTATADARSIK